jgi:hypothetical protein
LVTNTSVLPAPNVESTAPGVIGNAFDDVNPVTYALPAASSAIACAESWTPPPR